MGVARQLEPTATHHLNITNYHSETKKLNIDKMRHTLYKILLYESDMNSSLDHTLLDNIIIALRTTRASSRNVGKFYQTVKLSAKNLHLFHADSSLERCHFIIIAMYLSPFFLVLTKSGLREKRELSWKEVLM